MFSTRPDLVVSALLEDEDEKRFAAVIVLRNEEDPETLVVRREYPPEEGKWAAPGGHCNVGEAVEAAAIRELKEETGVEVEEVFPLERIQDNGAVTHLYYAVVPPETRARAADDVDKAKWLKVSELPALAFGNEEHVRTAVSDAFGS